MTDHDLSPEQLEEQLDRTERLLDRVHGVSVHRHDAVTWEQLSDLAGSVGDDGIIWDDAALAALALHAEANRPVPPEVAQRHLFAMHEALDHVIITPRHPRRGLSWRRRLAGATAAVTAFATFGGGAVALAQEAQPGDALYGLKRASETARLVLELDAEGDAALHVQFAQERLEELENHPHEAEDLLANALEHVGKAEKAGDPAIQAQAQAAGEQAVAALTELLDGGLPESASDQARAALERARDRIQSHIDARADGSRGRDQAPGQQSGQSTDGDPSDTPGNRPEDRGRPADTPGNAPEEHGRPAGS